MQDIVAAATARHPMSRPAMLSALADDDWEAISPTLHRLLSETEEASEGAVPHRLSLRILLGVCKTLIVDREGASRALRLLAVLPDRMQGHPHFLGIRLEATLRADDRAAARAETERLATLAERDADLAPQVRKLFAKSWRARLLPAIPAAHRVLWGEIGTNLLETLRSLPADPEANAVPAPMMEFLYSARSDRLVNRDAFANRLSRAWNAASYLRFLTSVNENSDRTARAASDIRRLKDLLSQLNPLFDGGALDELKARYEAGRNIVLLQAHAGTKGYLKTGLADLGVPLSFVGNGYRPPTRPEDFHVGTANLATLPVEFAKLIRLVKKGPRIVRIFPDGHKGGELVNLDVLGKPIRIGLGAATIAYYGKATLYFLATKWRGDRIVVELTEGPTVGPSTSLEETRQALTEFYGAHLRDIVQGAPEDFGLVGGMWSDLRGSFR